MVLSNLCIILQGREILQSTVDLVQNTLNLEVSTCSRLLGFLVNCVVHFKLLHVEFLTICFI